MKIVTIALAALALAGCAHKQPERVLVPVTVPCKVEMPKMPVWATGSLKADADIWEQSRALLAERRQHQGFEGQLIAAIEGCQPLPAGSAPFDR